MKERPILFKGEMVRAILAGTKTQTRRIVKPQPETRTTPGGTLEVWSGFYGWRRLADEFSNPHLKQHICPYGAVGDRLWVREACCATEDAAGLDGVQYAADCAFRPIENTVAASYQWLKLYAIYNSRGATCPSIFMPRWASRITLEITGVRVERLNDISEEDSIAEGVDTTCDELGRFVPSVSYRNLWESINGPGSWAANPWVRVVEFRRIAP
jgi:hypothetical protein